MALPHINPSRTQSWKALRAHFVALRGTGLRQLFEDAHRFERFHCETEGLLFDFSKNLITAQTITLLLSLATACQLECAIEALFSGEQVNETEKRPALHSALRDPSGTPLLVDGKDIKPQIRSVLEKMKNFSQAVIAGTYKGYSGKPIEAVVHIGIGGSQLGPLMVTEALKYYKTRLELHFVSNVDGTQLTETLKGLQPETTLFIIASKSFTTAETLTNAHTARDWFTGHTRATPALAQHFAALSANETAAMDFGIKRENIFALWPWVGGRYSIWGAIGLPVCLAIGFDHFQEFLAGAHQVDLHFTQSPLERNIPVLMALLGIWYDDFFEAQTEAILPYDQYLQYLPDYIRQSSMESNGKSVDRDGNPIRYQTAPIVWGGTGTDGQHAFFQLLYQGRKLVPCDFIAPVNSLNPIGNHHAELLANFFAQSRALAFGKSRAEVLREEAETSGTKTPDQLLAAFKELPGNQPSNSILLKRLTPYSLGQLLALYEHKVFVQGVIWNTYSFDQWGVTLGKQMARDIAAELSSNRACEAYDQSTNGLINRYKNWRETDPWRERNS